MKRAILVAGVMAAISLQGQLLKQACAHQIQVFAAVDAAGHVRGEVSAEGNPIPNAVIEVVAVNGDKLAVTSCDEQGQFRYQLAKPGRYRFLASLPDGHEAVATVAYARSLASISNETAASETAAGESVANKTTSHDLRGSGDEDVSQDVAELHVKLDDLGRQLYEIEREQHRIKTQRHWLDVIAAVGYILGIAAMYLLLKRRQKQ